MRIVLYVSASRKDFRTFFSINIVLLLAIVAISSADSEEAVVTEEAADDNVEAANLGYEFVCDDIRTIMRGFRRCFRSANVSTGYSINFLDLMRSGAVTRESFLAEVASTCR